jgi:hypothetical protein
LVGQLHIVLEICTERYAAAIFLSGPWRSTAGARLFLCSPRFSVVLSLTSRGSLGLLLPQARNDAIALDIPLMAQDFLGSHIRVQGPARQTSSSKLYTSIANRKQEADE